MPRAWPMLIIFGCSWFFKWVFYRARMWIWDGNGCFYLIPYWPFAWCRIVIWWMCKPTNFIALQRWNMGTYYHVSSCQMCNYGHLAQWDTVAWPCASTLPVTYYFHFQLIPHFHNFWIWTNCNSEVVKGGLGHEHRVTWNLDKIWRGLEVLCNCVEHTMGNLASVPT